MQYNTQYIDVNSIAGITIYDQKRLYTIHQITFPPQKFLWWTTREACVRYATLPDAMWGDTYADKETLLLCQTRFYQGQYFDGTDSTSTYFDTTTQTLYTKPFIKIGLKNGKSFVTFFDTLLEAETYTQELLEHSTLTPIKFHNKD